MAAEIEFTEDDNEYHPISDDIVAELGSRHIIGEELIHAVLRDCAGLWNPHRNELAQVLDEMKDNFEFELDMHEFPNQGVVVISDDSLTPIDMLARMNICIKETFVSEIAISHVVFTAHKLEAERLMDDPGEAPVVIRIPGLTN